MIEERKLFVELFKKLEIFLTSLSFLEQLDFPQTNFRVHAFYVISNKQFLAFLSPVPYQLFLLQPQTFLYF